MNISYKWLKEYLKIGLSVEALTDRLTFSGIEVEAIHRVGELLSQIVISKITDCQKHPNADKLSLCTVFNGKDTLQVVCGAPNCATDQIVALAPVGTVLGDITIKEAKIRGTLSQGMLCSEKELGISENHDGIMVLPPTAPVGIKLADFLDATDTIFEVEITPNRPDLLGMLGIARDLSAQLDLPLHTKTYHPLNVGTPFMASETKKPVGTPFMASVKNANDANRPTSDFSILIVEPTLCTRYTAVRISGVKIAPSPGWLTAKLKIADIKPINNIVDITNYVMYEIGHPLHAFDASKVEQNKILIRKSRPGEQFHALNHHEYELTGAELVIADAVKPIALAGVIGGVNSQITSETTDIILEAACFDSHIIRRTSHNLKIYTDSSYRFERGMADQTCEVIAAMATELILKIASGHVIDGLIDSYPKPAPQTIVRLRPSRVKHLLNIEIDNHTLINYLKNLGLQFQSTENETLLFAIPPTRPDLTREIDLIEEIIRLHGFASVPSLSTPTLFMNHDIHRAKRHIKNLLVSSGYYEAINLTFTDPAYLDLLNLPDVDDRRNLVKIINPQGSSFSVLRSTLIPQLLKNTLQNINHGIDDIKLFEMNKVFTRKINDGNLSPSVGDEPARPETTPRLATEIHRLTGITTGKFSPTYWKEKPQNTTFYDIKGVVEQIFNYLKIPNITLVPANEPYLFPNSGFYLRQIPNNSQDYICYGTIGTLDPKVLKNFDIDKEVFLFDLNLDTLLENADFTPRQYFDLPKYPTVYRDLSFVISDQYKMSDITQTILKVDQNIIKNVAVFDEFKGKQIPAGYRSISISISLCDQIKTLTDEQIKTIMDQVLDTLKQRFSVELR